MKKLGSLKLYNYTINLLICSALILLSYIFYFINFNQIEIFNRDALQLINFNNKISPEIATVSINVTKNFLNNPLNYSDLKTLVTKLKAQQPKQIIFIIEPLDITNSPTELKKIKELFEENKVWLNAWRKSKGDLKNFSELSEFANYKYFLYFSICLDLDGEYSTRRMLLEYYNIEDKLLSDQLPALGMLIRKSSEFIFSYDYLETKQIYTKSLPANAFGNYSAEKIVTDINPSINLKDKYVFVGRTDEFSHLMANNIFRGFSLNKEYHSMESKFHPLSHVVASNVNTLITGDYIKLYKTSHMHVLVSIFLILLVLVNISPLSKLYVFLLTLPLLIIVQIATYITTSIYIDLSSTYVFLLALQYLLIPIFVFKIINNQRIKYFELLNNTRIDTLLEVSEKVAHDIRSPLSAINLIISRANFQNDEQKNLVKNSLERIEQISSDLLHKYKQNIPDFKENLNVVVIINEIIKEKQLLHQNIVFRIKLTENRDMFALANKSELVRVLSNLIDNSTHALNNQTEPEVNIIISGQSDFIKITIEDNGSGIPTSALKVIGTQRFTTKQNQAGNGIGILHAKRSIEQIGGRFDIESIEGEYTKVTLFLPAVI